MADEEPFDAGDPTQVDEKIKADRQRERDKRDMLQGLLQHRQGRLLFWDYLALCGVFRISFDTNGLKMAFAEGQRNIGLRMQADILEAAPDFYATMLKENQSG